MSDAKDWTLVARFSVRGKDEDEARDAWADGEYTGHEILSCELEDNPEPVHIAYWYDDVGVLRYRASDGSYGSTPYQPEDQFQLYWRELYKKNGRETTFERIKE